LLLEGVKAAELDPVDDVIRLLAEIPLQRLEHESCRGTKESQQKVKASDGTRLTILRTVIIVILVKEIPRVIIVRTGDTGKGRERSQQPGVAGGAQNHRAETAQGRIQLLCRRKTDLR